MTKRELLEALEAMDLPDQAPVVIFTPNGNPHSIEKIRPSAAGPGVFIILKGLMD